jgi:transcriptional regulator with XRE-family HTH domain
VLRALRRGLAIDPARRPPSAAAFIEAIQAATRQSHAAKPPRTGQHNPVPWGPEEWCRAQQRLSAAQELAGLLQTLKSRSNLSYQQLARKKFASSSTLRRYCSGASVPPEYAVLARIAQVCGASPSEQADLLRCWTTLTTSGPLTAHLPIETPSPAVNYFAQSGAELSQLEGPARTVRRNGLFIATAAPLVAFAVVISYAVKMNVLRDTGAALPPGITGPGRSSLSRCSPRCLESP